MVVTISQEKLKEKSDDRGIMGNYIGREADHSPDTV
jgi:hypothetical protein